MTIQYFSNRAVKLNLTAQELHSFRFVYCIHKSYNCSCLIKEYMDVNPYNKTRLSYIYICCLLPAKRLDPMGHSCFKLKKIRTFFSKFFFHGQRRALHCNYDKCNRCGKCNVRPLASVTSGQCYLWQTYFGKCNYCKCIYGKSIMTNVTEQFSTLFTYSEFRIPNT